MQELVSKTHCPECGGHLERGFFKWNGTLFNQPLETVGYKCVECNKIIYDLSAFKNALNESKINVMKSLNFIIINKMSNIFKEKDIKNKEIAKLLDVTDQRISALTNSLSFPTINALLKIGYLTENKIDDYFDITFINDEKYSILLSLDTNFKIVEEVKVLYDELLSLKRALKDGDIIENIEETKQRIELLNSKINDFKNNKDCNKKFLLKKDDIISLKNWDKVQQLYFN